MSVSMYIVHRKKIEQVVHVVEQKMGIGKLSTSITRLFSPLRDRRHGALSTCEITRIDAL